MAGNFKPQKRLSCISCRQKKIKCDRVDPCGPCLRAGMRCIFPLPAPRRPIRPKNKSDQISQRLSRLEGLITALGGEAAITAKAKEKGLEIPANITSDGTSPSGHSEQSSLPEDEPHSEPQAVDPATLALQADGSRYTGTGFWSNISTEVEGLKTLLLETTLEEGEDDVASGSSVSEQKDSPAPHFVFGHAHAATNLNYLYPPPPQVTVLLEMFFGRFDPVFKVLHRPSVLSNVSSIVNEATRFPTGSGGEVLSFAMFYAGVTTMQPDECLNLLQGDKEQLLYHYEACVESALTNADILNTTDFTTLQAFVIYIICMRTHHKNRTSWSLISLAVRIATAIELNVDGSTIGLPPFQSEMRRRLWWVLIVLDVQGCEDRASSLLIHSYAYDTQMPAEINDEDLDASLGIINTERTGFTQMTFSLIMFEAAKGYEFVSFAEPAGGNSKHGFKVPTQDEKERNVTEVSNVLYLRFVRHCNLAVPIELKASLISQLIILKHWLLLQYPIAARGRGVAPKASAVRDQILSSAVSLLEIQRRLELLGGLSWVSRNWIQWHPMAVALAELCCKSPGGPLVERAWAIVDMLAEPLSEHVADSKTGSIWRPIKKLLAKARALHSRPDPAHVAVVEAWDGIRGGITDLSMHPDPQITKLHDTSIAMALDSPMHPFEYGGFAGPQVDMQDQPPLQGFQYYAGPAMDAAIEPVNWADWGMFMAHTGTYDEHSSEGSYRSSSQEPLYI